MILLPLDVTEHLECGSHCWAAIELDAFHALRCDPSHYGICVAMLPFIVGEAVWCVKEFGPGHGWKVVELVV
jgi:hypothetical protein